MDITVMVVRAVTTMVRADTTVVVRVALLVHRPAKDIRTENARVAIIMADTTVAARVVTTTVRAAITVAARVDSTVTVARVTTAIVAVTTMVVRVDSTADQTVRVADSTAGKMVRVVDSIVALVLADHVQDLVEVALVLAHLRQFRLQTEHLEKSSLREKNRYTTARTRKNSLTKMNFMETRNMKLHQQA